jgi:hypothetical protein
MAKSFEKEELKKEGKIRLKMRERALHPFASEIVYFHIIGIETMIVLIRFIQNFDFEIIVAFSMIYLLIRPILSKAISKLIIPDHPYILFRKIDFF